MTDLTDLEACLPRLVHAQLRTKMERTRVPERNYFETKLVSGGEFKIIKSAEFELKVHPDAIRGAITKKNG